MTPKINIFKSCNFECNKPTGFENLLRFALSLIANLRLRGHVTLPKIDIFKSCNFIGSKPTGLKNWLRFVLSLTVSEIMAN